MMVTIASQELHTDDELCDAILQVRLGQAEDLGGGLAKKRIRKKVIIGYMSICSQSKTGPISRTMNSPVFADWQRPMLSSRQSK